MLISVLSVFAVQILGFGVFQGRLITDEGMSTTVADASDSERYVGKSEHCAGWVCFFFTACISRFPAFAENDGRNGVLTLHHRQPVPHLCHPR